MLGKIYNSSKILNSHLFWLNSHPFFALPIICRLNLSVSAPPPLGIYDLRIYIIQFFSKYIIILLITFHLDTLKFNLRIIRRAKKRVKKGCEFNQKRCEFKILHNNNRSIFI